MLRTSFVKISLMVFAIIVNACSSEKTNDSLTEGNLILGQKPPGLTPQPFAPGLVSTDEYLESEVTFLQDMTQLSFTRSGVEYKKPTLFVMEYKDDQWSRKSIPSSDIDAYQERFNPSFEEIINLEPFKDITIRGGTLSANGTFYFYVIPQLRICLYQHTKGY